MQQTQVIVSVVEHDFDFGVFQQVSERRGRNNRQWVDNRVLLPGRELDKVNAIHEFVKARTFSVDRQFSDMPDRLDKRGNRSVCIEILHYRLD